MLNKLVYFILPFSRFEVPGWGRLLKIAKIDFAPHSSKWKNAPHKVIRGKMHGYLMHLDLSDWSQRRTYFLGRYYEREVQELLEVYLEPGDRFVDIGANIGMISLLGAYLVGDNGVVESFEPNPDCLSLLKKNIELNEINHIKIHPVGLSDKNETLKLNLTSAHTGTATLSYVTESVKTHNVQVVVGDDILLSNSKPISMIKMDVEGYELHALKGLSKTLQKYKPTLITEFIESHFQRAGTSSKEIKLFLINLGYIPYAIRTCRKFFRYKLVLNPLDIDKDEWQINDVLWINKGTKISSTLKKYIST